MARGFSATVGVGATDEIITTLTTDPQQRSWWGWVYARLATPGVAGRWFDQASATNAVGTNFFQNTTQEWRFNAFWSTTNGVWSPTVNPSAAAWHGIGISYDHGATTNNPIIYLDGTKLTVGSGITAINSPAGTYNSGAGTSFLLGNRNAADRAWDGYIGELAVWDGVLLTDGEFAGLARGARPYNIRPSLLAGYWPIDGLSSPEPDLSGNKRNGSLTGTALAPGPPLASFTPRGPSMPAPIFLGTGTSGARGFNTTLGVGTTDGIATSAVTGVGAATSTFAWVFFRANTGVTQRIWDWAISAVVNDLFFIDAASHLTYNAEWTTEASFVTTSTVATGVYSAVGVSYLGSATTDIAKLYINGVSQSVNTTAPTGTRSLGSSVFKIGNAVGNNRCFDGKIALVAVWKGIVLTDAEQAALAQGANPYTIRPASLAFFFPLDGLQSPEPDYSGFARNGTVTGTALASGPPVMQFTPRWPPAMDSFTSQAQTLWAQACM